MTDLALYTVKINGKSYTVAAEDTLGAAIKAAEAFEKIEGRDFDVMRDRFEGSFRHKPKPCTGQSVEGVCYDEDLP